jgi:hypothetical protein
MESKESLVFSNTFGIVTDKRITLNYRTGTEDIPINQVTSISLQHKRNYIFAIGGFAIGTIILLFMVSSMRNLGGGEALIILLVSLLGFLIGVTHWIGHHNIVISTGGNDRKPLKVEMAKTREGREFSNAIKKQIVR